ncbi:sensor histidine kinase [Asticcacaulis sp.]|uniref:sensor histidine kinase n=1 Tax=Asticcacaulis sp. TaxID=1872648 RepID=UPI002C6E261F|nr:sensor histidine kinase [Asticcacaulis sp.]HTM81384.1 sensor histidine kinase [Asticcacaulis sp.]
MKPVSLRLRLLIAAMLAIFFALALAWTGLNLMFQRHVEQREATVLIRQAERIVAGITVTPNGTPVLQNPPRDPRFDEMAGGLYWQVSFPSGALHSASLWDQSLPLPARPDAAQWRTRTLTGPFNDRLLVVERRVRFDRTSPAVLIQVAENDADMRQAYAEFGWELAGSLFLLWTVLAIAAWVQVTLGLRPLDRLRVEMERLRRSPAARLPAGYPSEIAPLITAINALADARESDLSRARRRAGDLAHSLKTPLSVLSAQSRRARAAGAEEAADGLDRAIAAVGATLEAELTRARSAAARAAAESAIDAEVLKVVEGLIGVIERTERGETLVFHIDITEDLRAPVAPEDLAEMLGALIENAARHARRLVHIEGQINEARLCLTVEDDGPGIDLPHIEAALKRGLRLDEAGTGHGLGLAIVRDLAEATEGDVTLGRSTLGGLAVSLGWKTPV